MKHWTKFRALRVEAKGVVLRSLILLPIVALRLRVRGTMRTVTALKRARNKLGRRRTPLAPEEIARLVHAASKLLRRTCLERSIVLWHLLRCGGTPAEIRLGVSKSQMGSFSAHAWVELDGKPLAEDAQVRADYAVFPRARTATELGRG